MPKYESHSFLNEKAAQEFIKEKRLKLNRSSVFPPEDKDLQSNECFLIPTPKEMPRKWMVRYRLPEK
jgi:hypothetical protein